MSTDERMTLRNVMAELMEKEGLSDKDMEQVDKDLEYSRGIRTLCVLDPIFDWQIETSVDMFITHRKDDITIRKETFATLFGDVYVSLKTNNHIIAVELIDQ